MSRLLPKYQQTQTLAVLVVVFQVSDSLTLNKVMLIMLTMNPLKRILKKKTFKKLFEERDHKRLLLNRTKIVGNENKRVTLEVTLVIIFITLNLIPSAVFNVIKLSTYMILVPEKG